MKFDYIYGKQVEQYDYLYIPKAFMKEEPFKTMTAAAKIMYAVFMEKQQKSVEMGWMRWKAIVKSSRRILIMTAFF